MGDTEKNALKMAAGVAAITVAVTKMVSAYNQFTQKNLGVYAHFEQMELGLTAMTGSAEKGKALFEELRTFSNKTTFGVDTIANATTQLLALGVAEDDVKDKLTQLGNIAGGSTEKFNRLVDVFVKIGAVGKASGIQLNQLSMITGVSWRKIMSDMGVAKPTFEDISKAFEKLTEEGEKFHGRMDAIIDTIEGKQGFIHDTGDELRALFADITGQAERYKARLDLVYDIQYSVLQVFKSIANNEVAKNLISGAYETVLIAIGGAIAGLGVHFAALVLHLKQVKYVLSLIGAATPMIALFMGLALAIYAVGKRIAEVTKDTREFNREFKDLEEQIKGLGELKGNESMDEEGKYWSERASLYESALNKIKARILELNALNVDGNRSLEVERLQKIAEEYEYELYLSKHTAQAYKGLVKAEDDRLRTLENNYKGMLDVLKLADEVYSQTDEGKVELEIEKLLSVKTSIEKLLADNGRLEIMEDGQVKVIQLTAEQLNRIGKSLAYIDSEVYNLRNPKKKDDTDWSKVFSNPRRNEGAMVNMSAELRDAINNIFSSLVYNEHRREIDAMQRAIEQLNIYKNFGNDQQKAEAEQAVWWIKHQIRTLKSDLKGMLENYSLRKIFEGYDNTQNGNILKGVGQMTVGYGLQAIANASNEAQSFTAGFQTGGVWGGIINAVISTFMDVAQDMEGFDMVVAPLHDLLDRLRPTLEVIVDIIGTLNERINESVQPLIDIINEIVTALKPILEAIVNISSIGAVLVRAIGLVAKAVNNTLMPVLKAIAGVFDFLFGWIDDWFGSSKDEREEEKELVKELNQEYKSLLQSMKENEEYYLARKLELNAEEYQRKVLGVNDMILTPHGNFSTNPQDTIIAMKHPENLAGGVNVVINNNADVDVSANERTENGIKELVVTISRKVAIDFAKGANGWDSAFASMQSRVQGRRVMS